MAVKNRAFKTLQQRLKFARVNAGYTQGQLADEIGVTQQAVQRLEVGQVQSSTYIISMAVALGVSPVWLEFGEGNRDCTCGL